MLEAIKKLKNPEDYHSHILQALGYVFINLPSDQDVIELAAPLESLGRFVIQRLKNQPVTLNEIDIERIVIIKRWDTTKRTAKNFKIAYEDDHAAHQARLDSQLTNLLQNKDEKPGIIFLVERLIQKILPQNLSQQFTTGLAGLNKEELYIYVVEWFNLADQIVKDFELETLVAKSIYRPKK